MWAVALPLAFGLKVNVPDVQRPLGTCGKGSLPLDLARRGIPDQGDCDELIPRYDMVEWMQHSRAAPDHPAVFVNTQTHEAEQFQDPEAFLARYGDVTVVALPEYAQSGGHLKNPGAEGRVSGTFSALARSWNESYVYFSDFKCDEGSLCESIGKEFGVPALFKTGRTHSKNFLVGGPDSGLPFHKHGMTWQGLATGRKAWYVLPPGSMTEELHDETGPYLFPVRAYHGAMLEKKLGQRPLYCVQRPGEVFYIPNYWWHSTMNLDRMQVAYGEKPLGVSQPKQASEALSRVLQLFPRQAWDTAGYTSALLGSQPMPYSLVPRVVHHYEHCGDDIDDASFGLAEPLRRMKAMSGSKIMACGLAETAAFAHCEMAREIEKAGSPARTRHVQHASGHKGGFAEASNHEGCHGNQVRNAGLRQRANQWLQDAKEMSPALFNRESAICRVIK